jgi:hypothetical protein
MSAAIGQATMNSANSKGFRLAVFVEQETDHDHREVSQV